MSFKVDGTYTTAESCGPLTPSKPFGDRDPAATIYTQRFVVLAANYVAPTIGAAHGTIATAYCVGDANFEALPQGLLEYDRQWATVPANRNEWGTFPADFPGLLGDLNPPYNQYWITDPDGGRDPIVAEVVRSRLYHEYFKTDTPDTIAVIPRFKLILNSSGAAVTFALPAGVYPSDTTPTKEDYEAMISAEDEIVAEDSTLERWLGNIYVRVTRYVVAI